MKKLILASASPRRKSILERVGYTFEVVASDKEGKNEVGVPPEKLAVRHALIKAEDVFKNSDKSAVVLGADTVVALNGEVLGKPADKEDAVRMLTLLSGKTHEVITGYAVISGDMRETGYVVTDVTFNELRPEDIRAYVESGLCMDKAGAYGIQDGYGLIKEYCGDYDNVVGLPINAINETIKEFLK